MFYGVKPVGLIFALGLALSAMAKSTWAAETEWQAGETEWLDIGAEAIGNFEYQSDIICVSDVVLREVPSKQSDKLGVLELKFYAKNKIEDSLYFDMMLIAYDSDNSIIFVSTAHPSFLGIIGHATGLVESSQYVVPGTLQKVRRYQLKLIGVRKQ